MRFYDDDNEEDEFTEEEITLAKGFCDACDKGFPMAYNEDEYDIIISNLMFAGRCISSDAVAFGALRVIPCCMAMGHAAGAAAALMSEGRLTSREIDVSRVRQAVGIRKES